MIEKVELNTELRQAIDEGQLFFCYQYLVDCKTSIPTGVEALVRWERDGEETRSRSLVFLKKEDTSVVAAPQQLAGPVTFEFRLAHR